MSTPDPLLPIQRAVELVRSDVWALILRGILFSCLINVQAFVAIVRSGRYAILALTDWDEPFYLVLAKQFGLQPLSDIASAFPNLPSAVQYRTILFPHSATDLLFGKLVAFFHLNLVSAAVLLDFLVGAVSYIVFVQLFRALIRDRIAAEGAALAALAYPWMLSLSTFAHIPFAAGRLLSFPSSGYVCLPILRAVYTQLSYPFYGLALFSLVQALFFGSPPDNVRRMLRTGFWSGILMYFYFYAWAAMFGVAVALILSQLLRPAEDRPRDIRLVARQLLVFSGLNIVIAAPGLVMLAGARGHDDLRIPPEAFNYIVLSLENLLLFLLVTAVIMHWRMQEGMRHSLLLLSAATVTGLILPNLQLVLRTSMQNYHYSVFYLDPLVSGCGVGVCLIVFRSRWMKQAGLASLIGITLLSAGIRLAWDEEPVYAREFTALATELDSLSLGGDSIAVLPIVDPFSSKAHGNFKHLRLIPYWIQALTNVNSSLVEDNSNPNNADVRAELTLGVLFTGAPILVGQCPSEPITTPGDLPCGVATISEFGRAYFCRRFREMSVPTACELIREVHPRFVLWESELSLTKPDWFAQAATSVWTSPLGSLELYEVDYAKLRDVMCQTSV